LTLFTVCKRHLAGAEPVRAAADEGGGRRTVMRRAESLTIERGRSAGQLDHHVLEPVVRSAVRPGHAGEIADPRTRVVSACVTLAVHHAHEQIVPRTTSR